MSQPALPSHRRVVIIGGGQAGLAMAATLRARGVEHIVLEAQRIAHHWRTQRWDSFCLVTPNWQCKLPGFPYDGDAPHGFMPRDEIVAYIERFADHVGADIREGVAATRLGRLPEGGFLVETSAGPINAEAVVLAVSAYHVPKIPRFAERLPEPIIQLHSSTYRNPDQLPQGAVLVVGTGQSGCQIAEDLHLAGRQVHLVVGGAPRCPRVYRGRDAVDWLDEIGQYDLTVDKHPLREKVRRNANHYLTGRDGGRDIDLRRFASEGMTLHGRLHDIGAGQLRFRDDLAANLDGADRSYNAICTTIDRHIAKSGIDAPPGAQYAPVWQPHQHRPSLDLAEAGITAVVWATGFASDWSWVELPMFDGAGYPTHQRGVTTEPGVYVLGMPWLNTWGSGRFEAVGRDAAYLAERISAAPAPARSLIGAWTE